MAAVIFLFLAVFSFWRAANGGAVPVIIRQQRLLLITMAVWTGYQLLSVMPLPATVIDLLSPQTAYIRAFAFGDANSRWQTVSLDVGLTLEAFLENSAYLALFLLVFIFVDTRSKLLRLVYTIISLAVVEAVWGLSEQYFGTGVRGRVAGTFANPNHFSDFIAIGIAMALGLFLGVSGKQRRYESWRARAIAMIDWFFSRQAKLAVALLIMVVALLHSASRAGVFALASALVLVLVGHVLFGKKRRRAVQGAVISLVFLVLAVVSFGSGQMGARMDRVLSGKDTERDAYRQSTYEMIADFPVLGLGGGGWRYLYPMYQRPDSFNTRVVTHAHNDIVQLLAEHGAIGFALVGAIVLQAFFGISCGLVRRRDPVMRGILLGSLTASLSLLIHAWWEFNFHNTAVAAYFFVILALGLVAGRPRVDMAGGS